MHSKPTNMGPRQDAVEMYADASVGRRELNLKPLHADIWESTRGACPCRKGLRLHVSAIYKKGQRSRRTVHEPGI